MNSLPSLASGIAAEERPPVVARDMPWWGGSYGSGKELDTYVRLADRIRRNSVGLRSALIGLRDGDPTRLDDVARRSYLHANGFAKIVLRPGSGVRPAVRLHVWDTASGVGPRGEVDPHAHRWRFASTVVAGEGLDVVHLEEVDPTAPSVSGADLQDVYRFEYDRRSADAMHPRGRRRLRSVERVRRGLQDVYPCDVDVVHTIEPAGTDITATVVVQGPARVRSVPVYRYRRDPSLAPRLPLTADQLAFFLDLVVSELG